MTASSLSAPELPAPGADLDPAGITEAELVLPSGYSERVRSELLTDLSREYICHMLCGAARTGGRLRLLACYVVVPQPDDYSCQGLAHLALRPEYDLALREECQSSHLSLVDVHSHPFAEGRVNFSAVDDRDELEKFRYFRRNLPGLAYGSVIVGPAAEEGRIFLPQPDSDEPRVLPLRIIRRDTPLTRAAEAEGGNEGDERFDRQVRAFGREGQRNLARLRVGVVGLGGLGSTIALGLTRLGIRDFVLIDPDRAEASNLNRVAGMTAVDARLGVRKVDLAARRMTEIDPDVVIDACAADVFEPAAWQKLRGVDLIVASTDNNSSRMLLNAVAHQYLVPLLSVGTRIKTAAGRLVNGFGELYSVLPGQPAPCLLCSRVIDKTEAFYELAPEESRMRAVARGYIEAFDEPAPAVYHLNGVMANLALMEIHNLVGDFMPRQGHLLYTMAERRLLTVEHEPGHCAACSPDGWSFARGDGVDPVVRLFPLADPEAADR